jgi:DNA primase
MFYSDDLIEEIRTQNDVVDVISPYVTLKKRSNSYVGLCPFHSEKSPSFVVSKDKQMYHCFGCGAGGNVITFIMEYENFSFVEAIKMLAARVNIELPEGEASKETKMQNDLKHNLLEIYKQAAKFYYYNLTSTQGEAALRYFDNRGISEETRKKFGLGYANVYSGGLYAYLKKQGYQDTILKESGLIAFDEKNGAYDKFWSRAMFPIFDVHGRVIAFGGRVLGDGMPKYLNSPETKLFDKSRNLYALNIARTSRKPYLLVCEGYMDVIALHQAGFNNAVASLGTAFTPQQASLLKRYTDLVYLTYDSDEAGRKATLRAIPILKEVDIAVKVLNLKPYKDPDDFIKAEGADAFEQRINEATTSIMFEIEVMESNTNMKDPESKTNFLNKVGERISILTTGIERDNYIEAVAAKYNVNKQNLLDLVNKIGARQGLVSEKHTQTSTERINKKDREDVVLRAQKILLTWLIDDINLFNKVKQIIQPQDFKDELYNKVAKMVYEQYELDGNVQPAKIINQFEEVEDQRKIAGIFSAEVKENITPSEYEKAVNETVKRIKKYSLDVMSRNIQELDELQILIKEQAKLQKLHISLIDG